MKRERGHYALRVTYSHASDKAGWLKLREKQNKTKLAVFHAKGTEEGALVQLGLL